MEAWRLNLRKKILGESVSAEAMKVSGPSSLYQWKKNTPKVEAKSVPQQMIEQVKLEEKTEKVVAQSKPHNKYVIL